MRTTHVVDNVYLITGAGGNVTVSVGDSGIMVIDSGAVASSDALLAAIREISNGPIRYVINTNIGSDHIGGNQALRRAGATFTGGNATVVGGVDVGAAIVAHEAALLRSADSDVPTEAQPTETFYVPKVDFYFNDEPVEVMYQPNAVDDTNLIVHFRRSDVIATGDVFRLDGYPFIDLDERRLDRRRARVAERPHRPRRFGGARRGRHADRARSRPHLRRGGSRTLPRHAHDHSRPREGVGRARTNACSR